MNLKLFINLKCILLFFYFSSLKYCGIKHSLRRKEKRKMKGNSLLVKIWMDWRDLLWIFYVTKLCKQGTSFQKNVQRASSKMQKKEKRKKKEKRVVKTGHLSLKNRSHERRQALQQKQQEWIATTQLPFSHTVTPHLESAQKKTPKRKMACTMWGVLQSFFI